MEGNQMKMREALVQCELFLGNVSRHGHPTLNPGDKCTACEGVDKLRGMVVQALSAQARNCDRYESEYDSDRLHADFVKYCNDCDCPMGCIYRKDTRNMLDLNCASILKCFARFALAAAKKGDAE